MVVVSRIFHFAWEGFKDMLSGWNCQLAPRSWHEVNPAKQDRHISNLERAHTKGLPGEATSKTPRVDSDTGIAFTTSHNCTTSSESVRSLPSTTTAYQFGRSSAIFAYRSIEGSATINA